MILRQAEFPLPSHNSCRDCCVQQHIPQKLRSLAYTQQWLVQDRFCVSISVHSRTVDALTSVFEAATRTRSVSTFGLIERADEGSHQVARPRVPQAINRSPGKMARSPKC